MYDSHETLNKIADWDFDAVLDTDTEDETVEVTVYNQMQDFLKKLFMHYDGISRISRQLNSVVQDFIHISGQVEQVAVFLNNGTKMQTEDIKRSIKLIGDFTEKINVIYDKSQEIISLAYDMENNNRSVRESVDQLVINQMKNDEAIEDIFGVIKNLIDKTRKIGEITKLINKVSSETNLLGLNAKVEAVHAGTYGRGFSVVADEIQRLSKESRTASVDISDMITSVTDEINHLEKVALDSKGIFKAQRETVSDVNGAVEKNNEFINTYISEQKSFNSSIDVIKSDGDTLIEAISNIFASVREVTATANEITSLTYDQNNTIASLGKLEHDLSSCTNSMGREIYDIKIEKVVAPKKRIMMIFDYDCEFFIPTRKEAEKAAGTYNYDVEFYAPVHRGTVGVNEMANCLDKVIEEEFDAVVICPLDDTIIYQKLREINSIGIKILFFNSRIDNIDHISYIQTNGVFAGVAAAQVVIGAMGNQGEVIVNAWSDTSISAIEDRRNGFVQEIKKNTNIKVHEMQIISTWTLSESIMAVNEMLANYPNARFIFMTNADWGVIAAKFMQKYNPAIEVITMDFTKELQGLMSEGLLSYAIGQRNYSWGSMAFNFMDKHFNGKAVPRYVDTGTYEVNHQNLNIYKSMV